MDQANESEPDSDAVEAIIAEFGGDARAAIRALLHDIDVLSRDYSSSVSRGYVRHEKAIWLRTSSVRSIASGE